jgi:hypothetical protein
MDADTRLHMLDHRVSELERIELGPWKNGVGVYRTTNQSINDITTTVISFDAVRFSYGDAGLMWVVGSPTQLTCVVPGVYHIVANVTWAASTVGVRLLGLRIDGATPVAASDTNALSLGTAATRQSVSGVYQMAVGDYVEVTVYQNTGGALNILTSRPPEFQAWRLL